MLDPFLENVTASSIYRFVVIPAWSPILLASTPDGMGSAGLIRLLFFFLFTRSLRLPILLLAVGLGLLGAPALSQRQPRVQIPIVPVAAAERPNEAVPGVRREQIKVTVGNSVSPDDSPFFANSRQPLEGSCPAGSSVSLLENLFSPSVSSSRFLDTGKVTKGVPRPVKALPGSSDSGPVSPHPSLSPASFPQSERKSLADSASAGLPNPVGKTEPSSSAEDISSVMNASASGSENSSSEDSQERRLSGLVSEFPSFSPGASRLTSAILSNSTGTHAPVSSPPRPVSLSQSSLAASPTPSSPSLSRFGTATAFFSDSGPASPRPIQSSESGKSLHAPTAETEHDRDQRDGRDVSISDETNGEDGEKVEDERLLTVTTENFDTLLSKYRRLLVLFFVPWCKRCQEFLPEVYEVAERLRRHSRVPLRVGVADASANESLTRRLVVRGYPSLKLFTGAAPAAAPARPQGSARSSSPARGGLSAIEYTGPRSAGSIARWLLRSCGPPAYPLSDLNATKLFLFDHPLTVLGVLDEQTIARDLFLQSAPKLRDVAVAVTNSTEVAEYYRVTKPGVVLFKPYDEGKVVFEGRLDHPSTVSDLIRFVQQRRLPSVVPFDAATSAELFGDGRPILVLVRRNDEKGMQAEAALYDVSGQHRGTLLFTVSGTTGSFAKRLMAFLNLQSRALPAAVIVEGPASQVLMLQFLCPSPFSASELDLCIRQYKSGELLPRRKSQPPLQQHLQAANIVRVVGSTFQEAVLDHEKEVLLFVYAPWCAHSTKLRPVFEEVAVRLAHVPGIMAAELDGTANEVEDVNVPSVASIPELRSRTNSGAKADGLLPVFAGPDGSEVWEEAEPSVADAVATDGYPALLFYTIPPRGSSHKKSITFYDGVRDVPSILDFLLMHSAKLKREHLV